MLDAYPSLKAMYDPDDGNTEVFYFKDATGNFSRIRTRGALLRKFPGRRREIRQALKDLLDTYPRPGFETYCEEFMKVVAP